MAGAMLRRPWAWAGLALTLLFLIPDVRTSDAQTPPGPTTLLYQPEGTRAEAWDAATGIASVLTTSGPIVDGFADAHSGVALVVTPVAAYAYDPGVPAAERWVALDAAERLVFAGVTQASPASDSAVPPIYAVARSATTVFIYLRGEGWARLSTPAPIQYVVFSGHLLAAVTAEAAYIYDPASPAGSRLTSVALNLDEQAVNVSIEAEAGDLLLLTSTHQVTLYDRTLELRARLVSTPLQPSEAVDPRYTTLEKRTALVVTNQRIVVFDAQLTPAERVLSLELADGERVTSVAAAEPLAAVGTSGPRALFYDASLPADRRFVTVSAEAGGVGVAVLEDGAAAAALIDAGLVVYDSELPENERVTTSPPLPAGVAVRGLAAFDAGFLMATTTSAGAWDSTRPPSNAFTFVTLPSGDFLSIDGGASTGVVATDGGVAAYGPDGWSVQTFRSASVRAAAAAGDFVVASTADAVYGRSPGSDSWAGMRMPAGMLLVGQDGALAVEATTAAYFQPDEGTWSSLQAQEGTAWTNASLSGAGAIICQGSAAAALAPTDAEGGAWQVVSSGAPVTGVQATASGFTAVSSDAANLYAAGAGWTQATLTGPTAVAVGRAQLAPCNGGLAPVAEVIEPPLLALDERTPDAGAAQLPEVQVSAGSGQAGDATDTVTALLAGTLLFAVISIALVWLGSRRRPEVPEPASEEPGKDEPIDADPDAIRGMA
jgi:hypothetical protein